MVVSLHSHSGQYCKHAKGNLEDVVKRAIEKGFEIYGLSEHMPRYRDCDLYPEEENLTLKDLETTFNNYVIEARELQIKYRDQITLLVGAETEFIYDQSIDHVNQLREKYNLDYIVGSVHHVNEIPIDFSKELFGKAIQHANGLDQLFSDYFDAQFELLKALKPEVIGHFDLINMFCVEQTFSDEVWNKVKRNIEFVISYNGLFELNSRAYKKKLPGAHPQKDTVQLIKSFGGLFTISDDSHGPDDVAMHYDLLLEYLQQNEITEIYSLTFQNGEIKQLKYQEIQNHPFWNQFLKK